jgi:hypothetical protein
MTWDHSVSAQTQGIAHNALVGDNEGLPSHLAMLEV